MADLGKTDDMADYGRREIARRMQEAGDIPRVGDTLVFSGVPEFFYPQMTDIGERARGRLTIGQSYTVSNVMVASSWCGVWLEGLGSGEGDFFHLSFFSGYPKRRAVV